MRRLWIKEFRLAASPLSYLFLIAACMTLLPGYPILMGAFFICLGLFQSFQNAREANDTLYTVLLPVRKTDFVRAKYAFVCTIQGIGFLLCAALTAVRMTVLSGGSAYVENALMNPSPVYLAAVLLIFAAFNVLFVGGFFRTAYKMGAPFLKFGIAALLLITAAEALHHFPGLGFLNTTQGERLGLQFSILLAAVAVYGILTLLSCRSSRIKFEQIDL